jgi:hypothetical protein
MFRTRLVKVLLVPAALMIPASAATLALSTNVASATTTKAVKCTTLSGQALATGSLTGCSDSANTGSSGTFPTQPSSSGKATIKWASGGKTTATFNYTSAGSACPSGDTEEVITGTVTKNTGAAKSIKIGPIKGDVCVSSTLALSLAPGTKFTIG